MAGLELRDIKKSYEVDGRVLEVFSGLSLQVPSRRITVVLGKSGCGKTTLLRLVGGLEKADAGEILFDGPQRTAFVFQEPRLMPWLDVTGNVSFGIRKKDLRREQIQKIIDAVGLSGFEKAFPHQLSGGMQQRTALARALAYVPSFILMDEPFASLDHFTREKLQQELLRIQQAGQISILFVTHSIDEALILGDKIVVIDRGGVKAEFDLPETEEKVQRDLLSAAFLDCKRRILRSLEDDSGRP